MPGIDIDMYETKDFFFIELTLAGVKKDSVQVRFSDDYLVITGMRATENQNDRNYYMSSIARGNFRKMIKLPIPINKQYTPKIEMQNGILKIKLNKLEVMPEKQTDIGGLID